jgi:hypothetical protein
LEPRFTDPEEIEKLINRTQMSYAHSKGWGGTECGKLKYGSTMSTWHGMAYKGPRSGVRTIFNVGSYKTGSTSVDAAALQMGTMSCKVGWGDCGEPSDSAFSPWTSLRYKWCPIWDNNNPNCKHNIDLVRSSPKKCKMLGDAPWPFTWPTAMRAYPNSKIILTRQKTCADWVYHVQGLWNSGKGKGSLTTCWFGASTPKGWYHRCVETERTIVLTAQRLKLPLLVLHATGPRSGNNMQKLAKFLGKHVSAHAKYPHVHTPSKHRKGDPVREPPWDEPDPNSDLWGTWNGGIPAGRFSWSLPANLANYSDWVARL